MEKMKTLTIGNSTFDIHDDEAVRIIAQELTEEQKEQVRTNIGALTTNDLNKFSSDKADIIQSASGENITINNAAFAPIQGLKLFGKTTQDGTPTPEAPVPLVSAGDGGSLGVTVAGKNLLPNIFAGSTQTLRGVEFNIDTDGKITASGTASDYADLYLYGSISNNGNYLRIPKGCKVVTYGSALDNTNTLWLFREKTKGAITTIDAVNAVLSVQDCYFYGVAFRVAKSATVDNFVSYAGIYAQSSDVIYEPYTAQTLPVSTPNGLPGIPVTSGGNYTDETGQQWACDEVDFARGVYVQRVCSYTTTGKEPIRALTDTRWQVHLPTINLPIANGDGYYGVRNMCSHLTSRKVYGIGLYENSFGVSMENMYFRLNAETTMAEITEFLGQGIDVKYAVDPIETPLSAEELAAYAALHTNYPNTTILNDGGAGMEVQYCTPLTSVPMVHGEADSGKILAIDEHGCVTKIDSEQFGSIDVDFDISNEAEANLVNADTLGGLLARDYAKQVELDDLKNNLENLDTGFHMELLWENVSPSSSFAAQPVSLDLTDFDFIAIDFVTAGFHKVELFEKKNQFCFVNMVAPGSTSVNGYKISSTSRTFTIYDTSIEFDACLYSTETSDYTEKNNRIIPTRIYGIKGVPA